MNHITGKHRSWRRFFNKQHLNRSSDFQTEREMKSANSEKMLAALALVMLVCSVTEGLIMNKCDLKAKLDAAQFQEITVMKEKINVSSLIARLVCKASISAFNTSFVKNIMVNNNKMKPEQAPPQAASAAPPQASAHGDHPQGSSGAPPQASAHGGHPQGSSAAPPQASAHGDHPQGPSGAPPQASAHGDHPQGPSAAPPQASAHGDHPQGPSAAPPQASAHGDHPQGPSAAPPQASAHGDHPQGPSAAPPQASAHGGHPQGPTEAPHKAAVSKSSLKMPNTHAPAKGPHDSGNETQHSHPTSAEKVVGHLYGVFQLSDQLACDSGMIPSPNVCNISCSALTDDDITDDITCVKTLTNFMKAKPKEVLFDVQKIVEMLLVKECQSVVPKKYFTGCP